MKSKKKALTRLIETRKRLRDAAAGVAALAAEELDRAEDEREGAARVRDEVNDNGSNRLLEASHVSHLWLLEDERHAADKLLRAAAAAAEKARQASDRENLALRARAKDLRVSEKVLSRLVTRATADEKRREQRDGDDMAAGRARRSS